MLDTMSAGGENMPTLHVRGVPHDLYARLKERAAANRRSLSAEVIRQLERAFGEADRSARVCLSLAAIRNRRSFEPAAAEVPDSARVLREDRAR